MLLSSPLEYSFEPGIGLARVACQCLPSAQLFQLRTNNYHSHGLEMCGPNVASPGSPYKSTQRTGFRFIKLLQIGDLLATQL